MTEQFSLGLAGPGPQGGHGVPTPGSWRDLVLMQALPVQLMVPEGGRDPLSPSQQRPPARLGAAVPAVPTHLGAPRAPRWPALAGTTSLPGLGFSVPSSCLKYGMVHTHEIHTPSCENANPYTRLTACCIVDKQRPLVNTSAP